MIWTVHKESIAWWTLQLEFNFLNLNFWIATGWHDSHVDGIYSIAEVIILL